MVRGLLRYQLNRSWYLISSPIIASDWTQPEGKGWIVPVGGGLGYSFRLGGQPIQVSLEGYDVSPKVDSGDETERNCHEQRDEQAFVLFVCLVFCPCQGSGG